MLLAKLELLTSPFLCVEEVAKYCEYSYNVGNSTYIHIMYIYIYSKYYFGLEQSLILIQDTRPAQLRLNKSVPSLLTSSLHNMKRSNSGKKENLHLVRVLCVKARYNTPADHFI